MIFSVPLRSQVLQWHFNGRQYGPPEKVAGIILQTRLFVLGTHANGIRRQKRQSLHPENRHPGPHGRRRRRTGRGRPGVDAATGGAISTLLKRGDLQGKPGQSLLLHSLPNLKAERVLLVGIGKAGELDARQWRKAAGAVAGITALDVSCAKAWTPSASRPSNGDYSDRSGFPEPPAAMRGKAEAELTSARAEPNGFPPVLH